MRIQQENPRWQYVIPRHIWYRYIKYKHKISTSSNIHVKYLYLVTFVSSTTDFESWALFTCASKARGVAGLRRAREFGKREKELTKGGREIGV